MTGIKITDMTSDASVTGADIDAYLAERGDKYDAIFLGSSRVDMQIMPTVFDQRMAELGFPLVLSDSWISDTLFDDRPTMATRLAADSGCSTMRCCSMPCARWNCACFAAISAFNSASP